MFSNNYAKFHAFITKENNSARFWPLAARLYLLIFLRALTIQGLNYKTVQKD